MVHGYHLIWGTYGFWLPNDPRGSLSDFVASWELARFGQTTKSITRHEIDYTQWQAWRAKAIQALQFPPVQLTDAQIQAVGTGIANAVRKSGYTIWACAILPEHGVKRNMGAIGRKSIKVTSNRSSGLRKLKMSKFLNGKMICHKLLQRRNPKFRTRGFYDPVLMAPALH